MQTELRKKIDQLIELDIQRQAEEERKHPRGRMLVFGSPESEALVEDILNSNGPSPVYVALTELTKSELAYVLALMWFGRGDGVAEQGATFESVLDFAKHHVEVDKNSIGYAHGKPLGHYLLEGLKRLEEN